MAVSVLKTHFRKFHQELLATEIFLITKKQNFINSLKKVLLEEENVESLLKHPKGFHEICTETVNQHALPKKSYIREIINRS